MKPKAFQDYYPEELSHCYGCGKNNKHGHQLKSYWKESTDKAKPLQTIATYTPEKMYTAIPGFVYGGLIASLIDCHGTGSAAAIAYQSSGREMDTLPSLRFVTGGLNVRYLAPTPQNTELTLIGTFTEIKERKVVVSIEVFSHDTLCATGEVIAVLMPKNMMPK